AGKRAALVLIDLDPVPAHGPAEPQPGHGVAGFMVGGGCALEVDLPAPSQPLHALLGGDPDRTDPGAARIGGAGGAGPRVSAAETSIDPTPRQPLCLSASCTPAGAHSALPASAFLICPSKSCAS